jgi:hypothetical protein
MKCKNAGSDVWACHSSFSYLWGGIIYFGYSLDRFFHLLVLLQSSRRDKPYQRRYKYNTATKETLP